MSLFSDSWAPIQSKRSTVRAIGPRLRLLLYFIFALVAVLAANSVYLSAITFLEWLKSDPNTTYQNWFYMVMFGTHLGLGLAIVLPIVIFGIIHIKNSHDRPNRRAVMVGYLLFFTALAVLFTGLLLTRIDIFHFKNVGLKDPRLRSMAYWAHVLTPLGAVWLYFLHRLAGPRIKWKAGLQWGAVAGVLTVGMVLLHSTHPRKNQAGSVEGKKYFEPSLAKTASGNFIPARTLMMDSYCLECHKDAYNDWFHCAHHFSSFNNQPYLFSVRETRQVSLKRDGNVKAARWCAGCHDLVPFFSGAFDNPAFRRRERSRRPKPASLARLATPSRTSTARGEMPIIPLTNRFTTRLPIAATVFSSMSTSNWSRANRSFTRRLS